MAGVRRAKLTGMAGSWRWARLLLWPFACLNPMPDDFPNHHDEDREETPAPVAGGSGSNIDEGPAPTDPETEGPAGGYEQDVAADAPDAGAPPADAGAEEDDVSP